jgi:hypothetical protein
MRSGRVGVGAVCPETSSFRRDLHRLGGATRVGNLSEQLWGDSPERRRGCSHSIESSLDHDMREPGFTLPGGVGENHAEAVSAVGSEA